MQYIFVERLKFDIYFLNVQNNENFIFSFLYFLRKEK